MSSFQILVQPQWITTFIVIAALWTIPWKGVALWKSARNHDTIWFVILLILNTLGILEILYIFVFNKKEKIETEENK